ncbi:uncharacterized protein LOC110684867 [Chenopodium quinoa]|uniref:uncharacterized protein LOC110684867 n=1 Tax=Chenopodium quinoa TaxID=63459 RepID=UPI000B782305|nr:uncharacterized protein LOC110684867 [Chenopodium quinoa]
MGDKDSLVDICLRVGGAFVPKRVTKNRQLLCWCGGWCYWKRKVQVSKLDVHLIRTAAIHGFVNGDMDVPMHYSCWYRQKGKTFNTGKRELVNSEEVKGLLETVNEEGYVEVFVTTEAPSQPIQEAQPNPAKTKKKDKKVESSNTSTIRRSPRFKKTETEQREESPPRKASANAKVLRFDEEKDDGCEGSGYSSSDFVARSCVVQPSRGNTFEVQLKDDQVLVDLDKETCTCYHWELTGIPCVHAYACILDMRGDIEAVVDPYYTMDTYRSAYEPAVQPMPGPKHWERVRMREPLPPSVKVQPGRPKSKKRKLEPGECSSSGGQASTKRKKQCSNCGGYRHYAKTCKVPAAPATELIKSAGRPPLNTPWMVEERKKKEIRAAKKSAIGAGPNSIGNKKFPQEQEGCLPFSKRPQPQSSSAKHSSAQPSSSQPSSAQPSSSQPASSQPKRKTRSSSSQPTTATGVVTRARLQSLNNLTQ